MSPHSVNKPCFVIFRNYIYLCGHVHITADTWRSKDNLGKLFSPPTIGVLGIPLPTAAPPVHLSEGFILCACVNVGCVLTRGWLSGDNSGEPSSNLTTCSRLPAEPFHQQERIRVYYRGKWVLSKEDRGWPKGPTALEETLS